MNGFLLSRPLEETLADVETLFKTMAQASRRGKLLSRTVKKYRFMVQGGKSVEEMTPRTHQVFTDRATSALRNCPVVLQARMVSDSATGQRFDAHRVARTQFYSIEWPAAALLPTRQLCCPLF